MISSKLSVGSRPVRSYTVEQHEHGVVVRGGSLPVDDFCALAKSASKRGFDYLDAGIGAALGGVTVFTNQEHGDKWRAEIAADLAKRYPGDLERQWFYGCDTGTSSLTMFLALTSIPSARVAFAHNWSPGLPHDLDDFGRCFRLLEKFPAWRERLNEVAAKYPAWEPFVREWANLEALYREELPTGNCPKLYKAIQALRKEQETAT